MNRSIVVIKRCYLYRRDRVFQAVKEAVDLIGGMDRFVRPGDTVLVKPNMLAAKEPERAITTHPLVLEAVVQLVKGAGGKPLIGDSPGGAVRGIKRYWKNTGFAEVAGRQNIPLVSFESAGVYIKQRRGISYYIVKPALDADVVINLPKLKTHNLTLFTGAVKNLFGTVPGFRKGEYHKEFPNPDRFAEAMVDIYALVKPSLSIMDGILSMEGNGPSSGTPRGLGLILASPDGVALDAVAQAVIGFGPDEVHTTTSASQQEIGQGNLGQIDVLGETLEKAKVAGFLLPTNHFLKLIPEFISRSLARFIWTRPRVDPGKCNGCQVCVDFCPVAVMSMNEKLPVIDYGGCINCMCCDEVCTEGAIYQEMSWLAKKFI